MILVSEVEGFCNSCETSRKVEGKYPNKYVIQ